MSNQPIKLLQITDCHLGDNVDDLLLSMNPDESLRDVLNLINRQHPENDFAILTGDLVNCPSPLAYQRLYNIFAQRLSCPFAWLPGNHDSPSTMAEFGDVVNRKLHTLGNWLIIMLDTHVDGLVSGHLVQKELEFLEQSLLDNKDKYIIVCLHHHPVPIGSDWIDRQALKNTQCFWKVLDKFSHTRIVLWGHIHQQFEMHHNDKMLLATPSTCIQFMPNKKTFALENLMPGYRWFELHSDGSFTTGVERVEYKNYGTDLNSSGY
ncbi:phosphodiesterase [Candidatus Endobugula sertula]|uniref:Phosphodiesterase n=1 Tax=Candidatus Endobugula sertula TaxID=62101 RepID=A0A1D2QQC0_9GAMM|nr:phosphodiesterase [Candidatus Endobugula sertula]